MSTSIKKNDQGENARTLLSGVFGFLSGLGLIVSGMTISQKVHDFLSFPTLFMSPPEGQYARFDPSLAAVMAAGMIPNLILHFPITATMKEPWMMKKWDIPTRTDIDWRLVFGAICFGFGWGMAGICPGPSVVLLSRVFYGEYDILKWMAGFYIGDSLALATI